VAGRVAELVPGAVDQDAAVGAEQGQPLGRERRLAAERAEQGRGEGGAGAGQGQRNRDPGAGAADEAAGGLQDLAQRVAPAGVEEVGAAVAAPPGHC
jgi:hypothetical protein